MFGKLATKAVSGLVAFALAATMCPAAGLAFAAEGEGQQATSTDNTTETSAGASSGPADRVNQDVQLDTSGCEGASSGSSENASPSGEGEAQSGAAASSSGANRYTSSSSDRVSADVSLAGDATVGTIEYNGLAYTVDAEDSSAVRVTGLATNKPAGDVQIPSQVASAGKLYAVTGINVPGLSEGANPYAESLFDDKAKALAVDTVTLPATVKAVSPAFFQLFPNLTDIYVASDNEALTSYDGALYNADMTQLILVPQGKGSLVLPQSLVNVPAYVFSQCNKLSTMSFAGSTGNDILAVQNNCLYTSDMTTLLAAPAGLGASASIAAEAKTIAEGAFSGNLALETIVVNGVIEEIAQAGDTALDANGNAIMVGSAIDGSTLPAFDGATIASATVVINIAADGDAAAALIEQAKAAWAAYGFTNFKEPAKPGTEVAPAEGASGFAFTLLSDYTLAVRWEGAAEPPAALDIPDYGIIDGVQYTVSTVADNAFSNYTSIITVDLPQTVTVIGSSAFELCTNLQTIHFDSVVTIGTQAFANTALLSLVLPTTVQTIGDNAFSNMKGTTIVALGSIANNSPIALGAASGLNIYVSLGTESEWDAGIPTLGNHIYPYGVELSSEPLELEVGQAANILDGGYLSAPGAIETNYAYKAKPISIDQETGTIEAKAEGSSNIEVSLSLPVREAVVSRVISDDLKLKPVAYVADGQGTVAPLGEIQKIDSVITLGTATMTAKAVSASAMAAADSYQLDMNFMLDGVYEQNMQDFLTFDVYVNGEVVKNPVAGSTTPIAPEAIGINDLCMLFPAGSTYEIRNVTAASGKAYMGPDSHDATTTSLTGTLNATTSITLKAGTLYQFDVNGELDGSTVPALHSLGAFDITISDCGTYQPYEENLHTYGTSFTGISDYYAKLPYGSTYTISNIQPTEGHSYQGVQFGSLTGTANADMVPTVLSFTTNYYYLDVNTELDEVALAGHQGYGVFDVYINGEVVKNPTAGGDAIASEAIGIDDFYMSFPYGTSFEIRSPRPVDASTVMYVGTKTSYDATTTLLSGTVGAGGQNTLVTLGFATLYQLDVNALFDGSFVTGSASTHTFTVKINGAVVPYEGSGSNDSKTSAGVLDFCATYPYGTTYEICDVTPNANIGYMGASSMKATTTSLSGRLDASTAVSGKDNPVEAINVMSVCITLQVGTLYALDVNGMIDGNSIATLGGLCLFDISIDSGAFIPTQVNTTPCTSSVNIGDFYALLPYGTTYSISNIRASEGREYNGVIQGELSGTIGPDTVYVVLDFTTKTYIFDVNGEIDDNPVPSLHSLGTVDVYINGELVPYSGSGSNEGGTSSGVCDFYMENLPYGTTYEIKNIQPVDPVNVQYIGTRSSSDATTLSLSGTIGAGDQNTFVTLGFGTLYTLDVNFLLNGQPMQLPHEYGVFTMLINGQVIDDATNGSTHWPTSEDISDFCMKFPYGTTYEITNIKPNDGYKYLGVTSGSLKGTVTQETIVVLEYTTLSATVTFSANGKSGVTGIPDPVTIDNSSLIAEPTQVPAVKGYQFAGWYREPECTSAFDFANSVVKDSMTLYAKWNANTYTISFPQSTAASGANIDTDGNALLDSPGQAPTDLSFTYDEVADVTLPSAMGDLVGYTFAGYGDYAAGTKVFDIFDRLFMGTAASESATLPVQWEARTFTVNFNKNSSEATGFTPYIVRDVKYSSQVVLPDRNTAGFSHATKHIGSWLTAAAGGISVGGPGANVGMSAIVQTCGISMGTTELSLYADWIDNDGVKFSVYSIYEVPGTLGTVGQAAGTSFPDISTEGVYVVKAGENTVPSGTTVDLKTFTTDYLQDDGVFTYNAHSYIMVDGAYTPAGTSASVSSDIKKQVTENGASFYVYYKLQLRAAFSSTDPSVSDAAPNVAYVPDNGYVGWGESIAASSIPTSPKTSVKGTYRFAGWSDASGVADLSQGLALYDDASYTACWDKIPYVLSFDYAAGSGVDMFDLPAGDSYYFDTLPTVPSVVNKTGYSFDGWYAEDAAINAKQGQLVPSDFAGVEDADRTLKLYGKAVEKQYQIRFYSDSNMTIPIKSTQGSGSDDLAFIAGYEDTFNMPTESDLADISKRWGYSVAKWTEASGYSQVQGATGLKVEDLVSSALTVPGTSDAVLAADGIKLYARWTAVYSVAVPDETAVVSIDLSTREAAQVEGESVGVYNYSPHPIKLAMYSESAGDNAQNANDIFFGGESLNLSDDLANMSFTWAGTSFAVNGGIASQAIFDREIPAATPNADGSAKCSGWRSALSLSFADVIWDRVLASLTAHHTAGDDLTGKPVAKVTWLVGMADHDSDPATGMVSPLQAAGTIWQFDRDGNATLVE